jgi:hypothetical protein
MEAKFEVSGLKETLDVFNQLQEQIGDKQAKSKILIPAVREAMKPVLALAKAMSPKDTGLLESSLYITARRPTKKDMGSRYISPQDSVISLVSTRPIPRKVKQEFYSKYSGLKGKEYKQAKKQFYAEQGLIYDARAIANEFGTAKMASHPFMRSSLESQAQTVSTLLGQILNLKIESFKSKQKLTK